MLLKKCYIENFGKLKDFTYEFSEGLNIICEENGWGKSTLAAFIRAMLYGLPQSGGRKNIEEAERRKYKSWQGGETGGYLIFEVNGKEYKAERTFGTKEAEDTFRLIDLSTNLTSEDFSAELGKELFGLDKEAYSRSTYLAQNKISDGGMNDSLGKKLGKLAEGEEDGGNFDKALVKLEELRKKYIPDRQKDEKGYVAEINREITETRARLEECARKEEIAKSYREKEHAVTERLRGYGEELEACRGKMEAAAGYEAALAKKKHYGELCRQEEELRQKTESLGVLFDGEIPETEELRCCRKEVQEAAILSGELRSYARTPEEDRRMEALREHFLITVPTEEEIREGLRAEVLQREMQESAEEEMRCGQEAMLAAANRRKKITVASAFLFVLAVGLLLCAGLLFGIGKKKTAEAVPESKTEMTVPEQEKGKGTLGATVCVLFGVAAAAGGVLVLVSGSKYKKAEQEAGMQVQMAETKLEESKGLTKAGEVLLARCNMTGGGEGTERWYRLEGMVKEYQSLAEREEKYVFCREQREEKLSRCRTLLERYGLGGEDVTASLQLLENRTRDYTDFSGRLKEATKKREQFEESNPPETYCNPVQPEESFAVLQEKEKNLLQQMRRDEEEEKDFRSRAEAYEKEAENYAELCERLTELSELLETKKREHYYLVETKKCLETAKEQFSSRYMRGLRAGLQKYLTLLGGEDFAESMEGHYDGVVADVKLGLSVSAYGKEKELGYFSAGFRDLIGLCMRFALVDAMFEEEEPFLVLDDPFVNFDEKKLKRGMEFLQKASKRYQILYLVCHGSRR